MDEFTKRLWQRAQSLPPNWQTGTKSAYDKRRRDWQERRDDARGMLQEMGLPILRATVGLVRPSQPAVAGGGPRDGLTALRSAATYCADSQTA
jgi:hypothetical protein